MCSKRYLSADFSEKCLKCDLEQIIRGECLIRGI